MGLMLELGMLAAGLYAAGWLSQRIGISPVVGYLALGLVCGPYGPLPVYQIGPVSELLGELGLIMLLFYLGLEFSLARFVEGGRSTVRAGLVDLLLLPVGVGLGLLLGLGLILSVFLGAAVYVSSSGVIARLIGERDLIAYPEAERTLGVLVFEDLAMVVVLAGLGFIAGGTELLQIAKVALVIGLYLALVRFGIPTLRRLLMRDAEGLVLLSLGLLVLVVVGSAALGFPEAVAAFLFGMAVESTGAAKRLEHSLQAWYDVAAATFFVSFAFHVHLGEALRQMPEALLLLGVTVVVQIISAFVAGRSTGLSQRASAGHGLMMLPRGEFSLVIVGLAMAVESVPGPARVELQNMVSLYVVMSVLLASVVFRYFDAITDAMVRLLPNRKAAVEADARQLALEDMTLE